MDATERTAVVLLGGDPVDVDAHPRLPPADLVVAADSGVDQALRLGLRVDLAVGDFDSVSAAGLAAAEAAGTVIERHPMDKDATDAALALDAAIDRGATRILVVGGGGGRLDHLLANVMLLAADRYAGAEISAIGGGGARLHVVRRSARITGEVGEMVSLIPVHGAASGVRTRGLRYVLDGETLGPGTSRGVSNQLVEAEACVELTGGVLLAVFPGPAPAPAIGPSPTDPRTPGAPS